MDSYEYEEMKVMSRSYGSEFTLLHFKEEDFMSLLNEVGYYGWELVGEVRGKTIFKRKIPV